MKSSLPCFRSSISVEFSLLLAAQSSTRIYKNLHRFFIFRNLNQSSLNTLNDVTTSPVIQYQLLSSEPITNGNCSYLCKSEIFLIIPKMGWKEEEEEEKLQGGAKGLGDDKSLMRAVPCRDHSSPSSSFCVLVASFFILGVPPPPPI